MAPGAVARPPQDPAAITRQIVTRTQLMVTLGPENQPTSRSVPTTAHVPTHAAGARPQPGAQPAAPHMHGLPAPEIRGSDVVHTNLVLMAERIEQEIGPTWRDDSAAIRARAASLRPMQIFGLALIGLGIAAGMVPGLRTFIGSGTTIAGMVLGGIGLAMAPAIVPGRESAAGLSVLLLLAVYWWAHRHGELRARANGVGKSTDPA